jgi:hypothetical protein
VSIGEESQSKAVVKELINFGMRRCNANEGGNTDQVQGANSSSIPKGFVEIVNAIDRGDERLTTSNKKKRYTGNESFKYD